ncbi:hypothetical protein APHAL10511_007576 [Amanita phalloides]|nr:hypothetical protein APHAL10511_007576 [Amanita phalloides]
MGIGSAIKEALKNDSRKSPDGVKANDNSHVRNDANGSESSQRLSTIGPTNAKHRSTDNYSLPSGTGPGTTGKPGSATDQPAPKSAHIVGTDQSEKSTGKTRAGAQLQKKDHPTEDTLHLSPVTHEHVRHVETEEVQPVKDYERHIHHIQHHVQPIITSGTLSEKHHEIIRPVVQMPEDHANRPEDKTILNEQMRQHHDTVEHGAKERTVIDKDMIVNEKVHQHVYHIIQPVIEKETIDPHRIHTTIPIHQVAHEAPVIHQSQSHDPIPIEHFLQHGGSLTGTVQPDKVSSMLFQKGQGTRDVSDTTERFQDLHVGNIETSASQAPTK